MTFILGQNVWLIKLIICGHSNFNFYTCLLCTLFFSFMILSKDSFFHNFIHRHNTIVHSDYSHHSSPATSLQLVNPSLLLASPPFSFTSFCFALVFNFDPLSSKQSGPSVRGCRGMYRIIGLISSYSTNDNDSFLPKSHHMHLAPQKRDSAWTTPLSSVPWLNVKKVQSRAGAVQENGAAVAFWTHEYEGHVMSPRRQYLSAICSWIPLKCVFIIIVSLCVYEMFEFVCTCAHACVCLCMCVGCYINSSESILSLHYGFCVGGGHLLFPSSLAPK